MGRYVLGLLLVGLGLLTVAPTNQHLLLAFLTATAIYFGYRLQMGSHET